MINYKEPAKVKGIPVSRTPVFIFVLLPFKNVFTFSWGLDPRALHRFMRDHYDTFTYESLSYLLLYFVHFWFSILIAHHTLSIKSIGGKRMKTLYEVVEVANENILLCYRLLF